MVEVPEGSTFTEGPGRRVFSAICWVGCVDSRVSSHIELRSLVRVSRQVWEGIVDAAQEEGANLIMLDWKGWSDSLHAAFGTTVDDVLANAPCDIVVVRGAGRRRIRRILLPVRGGPNAVLAAHLAGILAERQQARITALHVTAVGRATETDIGRAEEFDAVLNTLPDQSLVRRLDVAADEVEASILAQAPGASADHHGRGRRGPYIGPGLRRDH